MHADGVPIAICHAHYLSDDCISTKLKHIKSHQYHSLHPTLILASYGSQLANHLFAFLKTVQEYMPWSVSIFVYIEVASIVNRCVPSASGSFVIRYFETIVIVTRGLGER